MFSLRQIEQLLLGAAETPEQQDKQILGISTDSRLSSSGDLFFCLEGKNFDGHQFARQAVQKGAVAIIAARPLPDIQDAPVFVVKRTEDTLGLLAEERRKAFKGTVIAITGSVGKTTVKEMLAQVISQEKIVSKNVGNLNNQIGLPLSIFRADMQADVWIFELGISQAGDMDILGQVAQPDIAVLLNIAPAHLEGLHDLKRIAQAKASLLNYLAPQGIALVNKDYELLWQAATTLCPNALSFSSKNDKSPLYCLALGMDEHSENHFHLVTPQIDTKLSLPSCLADYAENIAAVAATAQQLQISPESLLHGLSKQPQIRQRFMLTHIAAWTLIDDTYNANPKSMNASMQAAREIAASRALVLVLGDMRELGTYAQKAHEDLGKKAKELGADMLCFKGEYAQDVAKGFGKKIFQLQSPAQIIQILKNSSLTEAVVLFKGSHSLHMEEYVHSLSQTLRQGGLAQ